MEFKGTKGKWKLGNVPMCVISDTTDTEGFKDNSGHTDSDYYGGLLICESIWKSSDALLISKAPEMLDYLMDAINENKSGEKISDGWFKNVEQLIKEAIEL